MTIFYRIHFGSSCKEMVLNIGYQLWKEVVPILQVWILIPQIQQLEVFQSLLNELDLEEKRIVAWQILKDSWLYYPEDSRIQKVRDAVEKLQDNSNLYLPLYQNYDPVRYVNITLRIFNSFKRISTLLPVHIHELMIKLIQTSFESIIPELVTIYRKIWRDLNVYHNIQVMMSVQPVSNHDRITLRLSMQVSDTPFVRELIILHAILEKECMSYLENEINEINFRVQMEADRLRNLIELTHVMLRND